MALNRLQPKLHPAASATGNKSSGKQEWWCEANGHGVSLKRSVAAVLCGVPPRPGKIRLPAAIFAFVWTSRPVDKTRGAY
jgi:hypothetical protein